MKKVVLAVGDEGLVAMASFGMTILVGRSVDPERFGIFALAGSVLLLSDRLQQGLVSAPLLSLGAQKPDGERGVYFTSVLALNVVIAGPLAVLGLAGGVIATGFGAPASTGSVFTALALALPSYQLRTFFRYLLYLRGRSVQAVLVNGCYATTHLIGTASLYASGQLTAVRAYLLLAATSLLGCGVGLVLNRGSFDRPGQVTAAWREHWQIGRWMAGSNFAYWGALQAFLFGAAGAVGAAAAGAFRAMQSVIGPTQMVSAGLFNLATPSASRGLARDGRPGMGKAIRFYTRSVLLVIGGYVALVALFPGQLLDLFYGAKYGGYAVPLRIIAPGYLVGALAVAPMIALLCLKRAQAIFWSHLLVFAAASALVVPLARLWGVTGCAAGLAAVFCVRAVANQAFLGAPRSARHGSRLGAGRPAEESGRV